MRSAGRTHLDVSTVVDLTRDLIRFNTVNPPGNEEEAQRFLGAFLADSGLEVEYEPYQPGRLNLVGRLRGSQPTGHLVFSGHMDVVPTGSAPWEHDPFAADLVDGRIVGRGAADMKGGVAAMAVAVSQLARQGFTPIADLVLAVSADEERGVLGAKQMAETGVLQGARYLVVGEPTGLEVCPAMRGGIGWHVTVHGKAAHSSTPERGISAISYAVRAALALEANPFAGEPHDLLGHPIVGISSIQSGPPSNIVPDLCTFHVAVRRIPGQDTEEMEARLYEVLSDVATSSGLAVSFEVDRVRAAPALETDRSDAVVRAAVDAVAEATGTDAVLRGFPGGTDAIALTPAYNAPFVIVGPGKFEQAHQTDEYVEVAELEMAVQVYLGIARRLLA